MKADTRGANPLCEESGLRDNQANLTGPVIEVATIDERHQCSALLDSFGAKIIHRLAMAPVLLSPGVTKRAIQVDRIGPEPGSDRWEEVREIGWSGLSQLLDRCAKLPRAVNDQDITELAAIGVMLLLIHELEGGVLTGVLQIGAGGDYLVRLASRPDPVQVEVSGIKVGSAGEASSRLGKKREQVRGEGFVSVTTFRHGESGELHSYLHFVRPGSPRGNKKRRRSERP
jgi:hypothetical protein